MTELSPALLQTLLADMAVPGRWQMVGVHISVEEHTTPGATVLDPPTTTRTRRVTATLSCPSRSLSLIFLLEGPEEGQPVGLTMHYQGTPFVSDDAALIARIDNAVGPMVAHREADLLARLEAQLP